MDDVFPIDRLPLWALFAISVALVMAPAEIGYRLGRISWRRPRHETESSVETLVAPALGLLAFILAFTFSLAQQRFETRRLTQLESANAIGTAFMRAAFAPEPYQSEIKRLLHSEIDIYMTVNDAASMRRASRLLDVVHDSLWRVTHAAAAASPQLFLVGLLVQSVNEVIDADERHINSRTLARIPMPIWGALAIVAMIGTGLMGYACGLTGSRRPPAMLPVALGFCVVMFVIADMDRPHVGFLKASHTVLVDLKSSLGRP